MMIRRERDRTKLKKRQVRLGHVQRRLLSLQRDLDVDLTNVIDQINEDLNAIALQLEEYDTQLRADMTQMTDAGGSADDPFVVIRLAQELPECLKRARRILGLSQTELAKAAGLKPQQINRYEQGNYENIQLSHALALCRVVEQERQDSDGFGLFSQQRQASTGTGAGSPTESEDAESEDGAFVFPFEVDCAPD